MKNIDNEYKFLFLIIVFFVTANIIQDKDRTITPTTEIAKSIDCQN